MKSLAATLLAFSAVVALGLGVGTREPVAQPTVPSAIEPASHLLEHAAPRTEPLRVMPTVYVTATVAKNEAPRNRPAVMLGAAVGTARAVGNTLAGGSAASVRLRSSIRTGLAVPYFAFAQASSTTLAASGTE
jgi:hypothetical protein